MVEEIEDGWEIGLRIIRGGLDYFPGRTAPSVGDVLEPSFEWDDGVPTDVVLDGTSTLGVPVHRGVVDVYGLARVIRLMSDYMFDNPIAVVLLAGEYRGKGTDPGEVLIGDAEVMAVWPL